MTYKIVSQELQGNSLNVTVDYTLNDGTTQNGVVVAMYNPQSETEILNNIIGRGQSIQYYADSVVNLTNLINSLNIIGTTGTI